MVVFTVAIVLSLGAAVASLLRGARYVHVDEPAVEADPSVTEAPAPAIV